VIGFPVAGRAGGDAGALLICGRRVAEAQPKRVNHPLLLLRTAQMMWLCQFNHRKRSGGNPKADVGGIRLIFRYLTFSGYKRILREALFDALGALCR